VDSVQLHVDHSQVLRAARYLELDQALDRAAESLHLEEVGDVVHPFHERDDLPVGLVLAGFLDPGVQVADHRLEVPHQLSLELDHQPQHAVRGRMVRPDVDRHHLGLGLELDLRARQLLRGRRRRFLESAHTYPGAPGSL
jgi:hypothetical protein